MKKDLKLEKIGKEEEDLAVIENSLFKAWLNGRKELVTDKNMLIFKVLDNLKVSKPVSINYLNILASRGIIRIEKDIVIYSPKIEKIKEYDLKIQESKDNLNKINKELEELKAN